MYQDGWYHETSFFNSYTSGYKVKAHLHSERSKYQQIDVYETHAIGRLLTLDGKTMVSDIDEFVYHEVMGHIPFMCSKNPTKALVIGGGDGGVVRELAKHQRLERIDLVEIDERVIEVSKTYFPGCTSALSDPRVNVLAKDGTRFLTNIENEYDIICIDSTDPEDFASGLFTRDFYNSASKALTSDGIMVAQTENPFLDEYNIKKIYDNLRSCFKNVQSYWAPMLIYPGVFWTFAFASKGVRGDHLNSELTADMTRIQRDLKWYNMQWHKSAFALSNFQKKITGVGL
ncbi:MAG: polyamine aminopropyltransferase [Bacteriovoracaceae bacterium]|jgi:spermidine synthase|nr:polyamine aminopropyltransferase [Bacteriovoracaceae bacterium]